MMLSKSDISAFIHEQQRINELEMRLFGQEKTPALRLVTKDWLIEAVRVLGVPIRHEIDEWGDQINYIDYEGVRFIAHKRKRRRA